MPTLRTFGHFLGLLMCGIAGAIWTDSQLALDESALRRMTDVLAHRGPDDQGHFRSDIHRQEPYPTTPGVALGHRRLAIIEPEGNRQPISNEDGTVWLIFNGEIYNYADLRNRLEGSGHTFRTEGDTETIVHLYEDEGIDFLQHLNGMFSLALWDQTKRRLILARDRLGQKPLVYQQQRGRLLFASELKGILAAPQATRDIDESAIDEYLTYQYIPHPNTIFRSTHKLPPGHYAVWENEQLTVEPYWQPDFNHQADHSQQTFVERLRDQLASAVQLRMRSDVPLGAFLSGGVDSSIIVALMQQCTDHPVKTFSVGFPVEKYDETRYARQVAKHLGTEHHEFQVEPDGLAILPKLIWHYDEPFADASAIPTYYVSQQTREHVTVALSGDGGDELFAGYRRYRSVRIGAGIDRLPRFCGAVLASSAWQWLPGDVRRQGLLGKIKRFAAAQALSPERRMAEWTAIFREAQRAALYSDEFLARLADTDPLHFYFQALSRSDKRDPVTAASLADLVTYLPCDLNTKVDIASMAVSLECRQPFLDHRVVELAAQMPIGLKLRGRQSKWILEKAFGHLIPREIFHRRKMGFSVPLDHWFRNELKEYAHHVLLDPSTLRRGYFRPQAVEQLLQEHVSGKFDHANQLWSLLVLELWHRQWVDQA